MKITKSLRDFLVSKGWASADATDQTIHQVCGARILAGDLDVKDLKELTKDSKPDGKQLVVELIDQRLDAKINPILDAIKALGGKTTETKDGTQTKDDKNTQTNQTPPPNQADQVPTWATELVEKHVNQQLARLGIQGGESGTTGMVPVLSKAAEFLSRPEPRVKSAVERYSSTKTAAIYPQKTYAGTPHPFAGQPATHGLVALEHPSERDKSIAQAYFKFALSKSSPNDIPRRLQMTEHDKDLLQWSLKNSRWTGILAGEWADDPGAIAVDRRFLSEMEQKTLLDDSTSGGIEIAPIEFDDALVTTPVLYGELYPLVDVQTVTRGRRIKGGAVSNPTFTSGVAEGTTIQPFNTSGFVSAFDTAIYVATAAMEIGQDFEEDSPTNVGSIILQKYGEKAMEWLDRVIAVGDGVTEPQGVLTSSAITVIQSDFGAEGPATVGDYEGMMFGVSKAFRTTKGPRNIFFGSDTSYRRARAIPVAPGDERRIFGMDHLSYTLLGLPYKIQVNIPNNQTAFANMGYYRMYRRLGMNVKVVSGDVQSTLRNTRTIVVRMRYGGKITLGGAACCINDGQN